MIWNESYIAVAGKKHPKFFGCPARQAWGEVWDGYDPLFKQMRIDGKSFKHEGVQLFINRNGYLEEGYFNLRVMPVQDESSTVIGFYEPVIETTRQVLAGRRLETLLQVGQSLSLSTCIEDLWPILLKALHGHEDELYFAALYLPKTRSTKDPTEDVYALKGGVGINVAHLPALAAGHCPTEEYPGLLSAIQHVRETESFIVLRMADGSLSDTLLQQLRKCGLKEDCRSVVVSPLKSETDGTISAILVIGTSPKREYDDDYALFVQLLVRQIEGTVTFMELFESERHHFLQKAAHESEVRVQTFAERAQVGIFIFDPQGAVKFCNDAWLDLCGLTRDQIETPMSWVETVHPDNASEIVQYWDKIANGEGPSTTFEVQYKKPWRPKSKNPNMSLDRTYVLASAYAEHSDSGKLTGIMGCVTDISHVKWAEKIQLQRLEEALELKRQQENFLDITSHEMRNPLNAILHCATDLVEQLTLLTSDAAVTKPRTAILKEALDAALTIEYCGKHQKRIIDDVLTVSKLDSNLLVVAPLSSRPPQIVQRVLNVFETEIRASFIETEVEISDSYRDLAIDAVFIDPHRVIQIIINLFSNAIKFLKGESHRRLKIVISASIIEPTNSKDDIHYVPSGKRQKDPTLEPEWGRGEPLFLMFSVQDTGPGMTPEEADTLFHRFIQGAPRTHSQYGGGSGLGLFISRELTELHGGRIGLSSQVGTGSIFEFFIKGRRDITGTKDARRPSTSFAGSSPPPSMPKPHAIVARLRDSAVSPGSPPPLKETRSSPSVMQLKNRTDKLRVLVVEDNLINQQILKKLMKKQGYEVSIANHGEEALAIIESSTWFYGNPNGSDGDTDGDNNGDIFTTTLTTTTTPSDKPLKLSLILCDVEMPIMDGKTTVRRIREMQKMGKLSMGVIPVIAVTGNARPEQIREALECGFDDVVSKPYEVGDLIERVRRFTVGIG